MPYPCTCGGWKHKISEDENVVYYKCDNPKCGKIKVRTKRGPTGIRRKRLYKHDR